MQNLKAKEETVFWLICPVSNSYIIMYAYLRMIISHINDRKFV